MADTLNLALPMIAAAQAQKHVTVNEALARLDGLTQLRLISKSTTIPPVGVDGMAYAVPTGAVNDWAGNEGRVAIYSNGGWVFADPALGWRAFIVDEGTTALHNGTAWVSGALSIGASGSASRFETLEATQVVGAGASVTFAAAIPTHTLVFGVTGRVTDAIAGTASAFDVGVGGALDRYGSGYGVAQGSYVSGLTGSPQAYYADTDVLLTATGGTFSGGGSLTLAVHCFRMDPPS